MADVSFMKTWSQTMNIVEAIEKDQPQFHWGGRQRWNAAPGTLREIQRSVSRGMRTLETGCGASTVVFAAKGARHTIISPTRDEHERVLQYLNKIGVDGSLLHFEPGFSDDVLPRICSYPGRVTEWDAWFVDHLGADAAAAKASSSDELWRDSNERCFDYVFLDGAHSFPYPVI
ncbi:MAG TPA: hypothetical protein VL402_12800, partial [Xanthobacteraceae bacterium]|nr:hypothetical protein [Xanthobacteraceae bacterium]